MGPRKPLVYVETSVISFHEEIRTQPAMVARREWTRSWWASASTHQRLFTSVAVLEELDGGDYPTRDACLKLASSLPLLEVTADIAEIVEVYISRGLMPADPAGDALHLALASVHRCDFLATWNCKHIANANKFGHVRSLNPKLGLFIPALVTPLELSQESESPNE